MLLQTCPDNAKAEYKERFGAVHELLKLLMEHEAMSAVRIERSKRALVPIESVPGLNNPSQNATQTYMTPAASKNKVYFM